MEARSLIVKADEIAREQGLNQREWSTASGHAVSGQTVSRIISKGDCRMSTFIDLLKPLGLELVIIKADEEKERLFD